MALRHKFLMTVGLFYLGGAFAGPIGFVCVFVGSFFAWETYAKLY